jgi:hypothetical protein
MKARIKTFGSPLGRAEHHEIYVSTNVRKTLDTTLEIGRFLRRHVNSLHGLCYSD